MKYTTTTTTTTTIQFPPSTCVTPRLSISPICNCSHLSSLQAGIHQTAALCQLHHITSCLIKTYRGTSETYHGWALQTNNMEEDMSCLLGKNRWLCAGNGVRCREFLRTCNHIIYNFGPTSANLQQLSCSQISSLCSVYHNRIIWS